jgi:hypothetical protein
MEGTEGSRGSGIVIKREDLMIKDERTAALCDDIIGAAQILERAAKRLRESARNIRADGLFPMVGFDAVDHMRMHKGYDVKEAATAALREVKAIEAGVFLTEWGGR